MTPFVVRMIRITTITTRPDLAALPAALECGLNSALQVLLYVVCHMEWFF